LRVRDREIYRSIFKANPPDFFSHQFNSNLYSQIDSSSDLTLVNFSTNRAKFLDKVLISQNNLIAGIIKQISNNTYITNIPSITPIKGMNVSQTGATIGKRIHPFYKTPTEHTGVDLLASLGTEVHSTAGGIVIEVVGSDRGRGNQVTIQHDGGYITKYAHLGDVLVRKSQLVKQNTIIGRVGNSGLSFAPHLHYEVILNGEIMDPVNYFFADLSPYEYREMMIIAMSSGQSLD
jgi:murein DD-endopeptidase MepM/ murein hydrolase activator NlpD